MEHVTFTSLLWFCIAAFAIFLEIITGASFLFLWLGLCAVLLGCLLLIVPTLSWQMQFTIYAILSTGCLLAWKRYLEQQPSVSQRPLLNKRSEQLIGRVLYLETDLINGYGKAKFGDTFWSVTGENLPRGTAVAVKAVLNGTTLEVEKIQ